MSCAHDWMQNLSVATSPCSTTELALLTLLPHLHHGRLRAYKSPWRLSHQLGRGGREGGNERPNFWWPVESSCQGHRSQGEILHAIYWLAAWLVQPMKTVSLGQDLWGRQASWALITSRFCCSSLTSQGIHHSMCCKGAGGVSVVIPPSWEYIFQLLTFLLETVLGFVFFSFSLVRLEDCFEMVPAAIDAQILLESRKPKQCILCLFVSRGQKMAAVKKEKGCKRQNIVSVPTQTSLPTATGNKKS